VYYINYLGDQIKKDEMGGACSTYGESRDTYVVLVGKTEGRGHLEELGVDWVYLARDRDKW
jgi:hypothetical protein